MYHKDYRKNLASSCCNSKLQYGSTIKNPITEISQENYSDIFILDDASNDGSREIVEDFNHGKGVNFITHSENKGAGSARNLIINALGYQAIIHFMDADVSLGTKQNPERAQELMSSQTIGFIGGLALNDQGIQNLWNYGPRQGLKSDAGAIIQKIIESKIISNPDKAKKLEIDSAIY